MPAAYGVSGARAGQVDHRLLLVERALLGRKVEAGEDDDVVEAIRPPLSRPAGNAARPSAGLAARPRRARA